MNTQGVEQRLLARRAELRALIPGSRDRIAIERYADPSDSVGQHSARDVAATEMTRLSVQLAGVEAALARLADGSYGICCDCGLPIHPRRLEAMPEAARCARCQGLHESRATEASCGTLLEPVEA